MNSARWGLCVAAAGALVACTPRETVTDQGRACAKRDLAATFGCEQIDLRADEALSVFVDFGVCLSSSCNEIVSAECSVTREGTVLRVSATATYTEPAGPFVGCTADCRSLIATCQSEPLPPGVYSLRYAGQEAAVEIPSTTARGCTPWSNGRVDALCCDSAADCPTGTCGSDSFCR